MVEHAGRSGPAVFLDDRLQLIGAGSVQDDVVSTEVGLATDSLDALGRGAGRCRG